MITLPSRVVAPLSRRRTQLKEKGKSRPHKKIAPRLPAGAGALDALPKCKDYMASASNPKRKQTAITEYCKAVRGTVFVSRRLRHLPLLRTLAT